MFCRSRKSPTTWSIRILFYIYLSILVSLAHQSISLHNTSLLMTTPREITTMMNRTTNLAPRSMTNVYLWPPEATSARHSHLFHDGLKQSPYLRWIQDYRTMKETKQEVVWVLDLMYHEKTLEALQEGLTFYSNHSNNLLKRIALVDYGDRPSSLEYYHEAFKLWERYNQYNHVTNPQPPTLYMRSMAINRHWDEATQWIDVGQRRGQRRGQRDAPFQHVSYPVRTDTVLKLHQFLRPLNLTLKDPLEAVLDRPVDVAHFWPRDPGDQQQKVGHPNTARFRYRISQLLYTWGRTHRWTTHVGLVRHTSVGRPGRQQGATGALVQAMARTKLLVVAQRDGYEDHYRLFEALIGGAAVLTDFMHGLPSGLEHQKSILVYRSADELQRLILYYLEHEDERQAIAAEGRRIAMTRHRSWHRMEEIVLGGRISIPSATSSHSMTPGCPWTVNAQGSDDEPHESHHPQSDGKQDETMVLKQPQRPLVFGAGHGTTGTRTQFRAVCALGVPSVHFRQECLEAKRDSLGWKAHHEFVEAFREVKNCQVLSKRRTAGTTVKKIRGLEGCPKIDRAWIDRMHGLIDQVIASPDVDGIFDTPYPYFTSYILEVAERIRGVAPILVFTERNATEWARRRSDGFAQQAICEPRILSSSLEEVPVSSHVSQTIFRHKEPFDVDACYEATRQQHPDGGDINWKDMFMLLENVLKRRGESLGLQLIASGFQQHQDTVLRYTNYSINLFTRQPSLTMEQLSLEMNAQVPAFCQYWKDSPLRRTGKCPVTPTAKP